MHMIFTLILLQANKYLHCFYRYLTKRPHLAGTKLSKDQAEYVADKLRKAGFDKVKIHMYTILLSYPQKPGNVRVLAANGSVIHTFDVIEPAVVSSENVSEVVYPFNAYSPAATVEVSRWKV